MDLQGICTFCNASCLKMLGYERADQLLGKNMHLQIHHSHRDGRAMPIHECKIYQSIQSGSGTRADNEVFWRADGARLDVEYYSYPQCKNGKVVGAVITFMDISERKKAQEEIQYLSFHDGLTGLYNRSYFEAEMKRLDTGRNLPISIIVCDVNNLKLTNDVFGHSAGDRLLQKVADIFRRVCRSDDIIARTGGDEFVILLPRTSAADAVEVQSRIRQTFLEEQIEAINVSISMGTETKIALEQSLDEVMENAEDKMYQDKTLNRKTTQAKTVNAMLADLHARHPWEKEHAERVSDLCRKIGRAMALSESDIRRLAKAAFLHDVGKTAVDDAILDKNGVISEDEKRVIRQHPAVGYRILYAFDETMDLAEIILAHHERWDGSGYPRGAREDEIPLLARVIAVAESYDTMTTRRFPIIYARDVALEQIEALSGQWYDPAVVAAFITIMRS
jgi:diguanylate cyclase (GGDEF)-like protein/PAS domain S-box-containing protein/putative nucleotidyltransferase with HDIG domain